MYVQVPSDIVRNENFYMNNGDMLLYTRLVFLYFRMFQNEEIKVDHRKLMYNTLINDTRTLKKRLLNLSKHKLIHNDEIVNLPRRGEITIQFNGAVVKDATHFTQMNANIFNILDKLDDNSFRLLFYYKSHINMDDKDKDKSFCYVGYDVLEDRLKMSSKTIKIANESLRKNKLIKIVKHKLESTDNYGVDNELIYDRYNNHYYVHASLF